MKSTLPKVLSSGLIVFGMLFSNAAIAQTYQRADTQTNNNPTLGVVRVENPGNAVDAGSDGRGDLTTASTIKASPGVALGGGAYSGYQELIFPTGLTLGANQTTYVKLETDDNLFPALLGGSLGSALAGVLGTVLIGNQEVTIQAKNNSTVVLSGQTQNSTDFSTESLRIVSDADNNYYAALTPSSAYDRIRIENRVGSLLGLGITKRTYNYGAYFNTGVNNCE